MSERAWSLCIVSSAPQAETIIQQRKWAEEAALRNGWELEESIEGVASGKKGVRLPVSRLIARLRTLEPERRPQWLLMVRDDRLGRGSIVDSQVALRELKELGVRVFTRDQGELKNDSAMDELISAVRLAVARHENEVRADRAKAGKERRRTQGLHLTGKAPYGCVIVNGLAVAYEPEANVLREIFERRVDGWGYDRLAHYAALHAPPKRLGNGKSKKMRWSRSTIRQLLLCSTLRGTAVEEELYDAASGTQNADFKSRSRRSWAYPVAGAIRCTCGHLVIGQVSGRPSKHERYYVCRNVAEHRYYPHWRASKVEEAFEALLHSLAADPGILVPARRQGDRSDMESSERGIRKELESVEALRRQIWEKAESLTGEQMRERLDEIDAERSQARGRLEALRSEILAATEATEQARTLSETLERMAQDWPMGDLRARQDVAQAVSRIVGLKLAPTGRTPPKERRRGHGELILLTEFDTR